MKKETLDRLEKHINKRPKDYLKISEGDNYWNIRECPDFINCSKNICPLDYEMFKRSAIENNDFCKYIREPKLKNILGKDSVCYGRVMPDELLKFVPEHNAYILNEPSRKRWYELHKSR